MNFKKVISMCLVIVVSLSLLAGCSKPQTEGPSAQTPANDTVPNEKNVELLISAAASLTDVLNEIADVYKDIEPNTKLTYSFGSSGALQAQIEEGAPVDIFMSAAQKQMKALEDKGLILDGTNKTLLVNKVVLMTPANSNLEISSFDDLTKDEVKKIAIGDPSNVPVGQYSEEIFTNLNILDKVSPKTVLGNDVRTVLTWVESGEVDCGIVYATDAYTTDKVQIITEAPEGSHKEVSYPVAVVKTSKNSEAAKRFLDFLSTEKAINLFTKYGFTMK